MKDDNAGGGSGGHGTASVPAPPLCMTHGEPRVLLACKRGANSSRLIFKYGRLRLQQSEFFKWADELKNSVLGMDDDDCDLSNNSKGHPPWNGKVGIDEKNDYNEEDDDDDRMPIDKLLIDVLGYGSWMKGQRKAVKRLQKQYLIAVFPTAGGK